MKLHHLLHALPMHWTILFAFALATIFAVNGTPTFAAGTVTNCSDDSQFSSALAGGGSVTFSCGAAIINFSTMKTINANTTIDGGGLVTLSGNNTNRLFFVNAGKNLTLNNIVLTNGFTTGNAPGGAVYVDQGTLVLNNSTIQNSRTIGNIDGSAVYAFGGTVSLNNSIVQGNLNGNGAINSTGTLTITNSILRNNTGSQNGGALIVAGTATINDSQIYSNTVGAFGGGGIFVTGSGDLTINNSQIYLNQALGILIGGGGGIKNGGTLIVTQSSFIANSGFVGGGIANNGTAVLRNVIISTNAAFQDGGGLYNDSTGTLTLTRSTISGNSAVNGLGGGILNSGTATLMNATLSGNSAGSGGGGIYNFGGSATLTSVTLSQNSAKQNGGGIAHNNTLSNTNTIHLGNTIVANSRSGGNCYVNPGSTTVIASYSRNLSTENTCAAYLNGIADQNNNSAQLGPLANNGGFTLTHLPLLPIVKGIGPIDNGSCPVSTDQRDVMRPQGAACDIGAVEYRTGDVTPWLYLPLVIR